MEFIPRWVCSALQPGYLFEAGMGGSDPIILNGSWCSEFHFLLEEGSPASPVFIELFGTYYYFFFGVGRGVGQEGCRRRWIVPTLNLLGVLHCSFEAQHCSLGTLRKQPLKEFDCYPCHQTFILMLMKSLNVTSIPCWVLYLQWFCIWMLNVAPGKYECFKDESLVNS